MKVDIIGAGSLGLLFTSKLLLALNADNESNAMSEAGKSLDHDTQISGVRLWTRTEEQARIIREEGIRIVSLEGEERTVSCPETYSFQTAKERLISMNEKVECLWLFVKQTHLDESFMKQLVEWPRYASKETLVCFQNGVGHLERLRKEWPLVLAAVTTEAAKREGSNVVRRTGTGTTFIGETSVSDEKVSGFVKNMLNLAGFQVFLSNNIEDMMFRKLVVNAVINPLTTVLSIQNGELLATEERIQLMKLILAEVVAVFTAAQIPIKEHEAWEQIVTVCERTARNTSSMLQDRIAGNKTEIDAITGAILRMAAQHHVQVPMQQALYRIIQAM
ncbi:ketopantoate reductase family protein [Paenibacillus sp. 481]|uniref:ketopantoate reductase family protein n=1 Tax=Paenibacillus sp. 481 TaxID=2835869 RepID=UPI001E633683|nr:2-dehydropantoate 2-reductase [Paenibacillus sp. 481]UHA74137.1 2-dehydropantoate 2-reductase [Paenibacillus sp. 481]